MCVCVYNSTECIRPNGGKIAVICLCLPSAFKARGAEQHKPAVCGDQRHWELTGPHFQEEIGNNYVLESGFLKEILVLLKPER